MAGAQSVVELLDGVVFGLEPGMPVAAGLLVEGEFRVMAAEAVVDLPGDELGMFAEGGGHGADDAAAKIPVNVAVEAAGAAGAFVAREAAFVEGQDFGIFFGEPDGRGGGGGAEDDLDAGP